MTELPEAARAWLNEQGIDPRDDALWLKALTHGSAEAGYDYERLEFLGDRVLGLTVAAWLFEQMEDAEGKLSLRLNALVSRHTCARVARAIGVVPHIQIGKQARSDGALDSDNLLGDVMESLLGASYLERGFDVTEQWLRSIWSSEVDGDTGRRKHPKSALQEWAAGNQRRPPEYELVDRSGPDHAARFTVRVAIKSVGSAQATASSKQEAETLAARNFMEQYG